VRRLLGLVALVLVPAAVGAPGPIVIGGAGPPSSFTKGAAAYFRYANAYGGVRSRTIEYRLSTPEAVEPQQALALLGPEVDLGGATVRLSPTPAVAGAVLARHVRKTAAKAAVAVVYGEDEDGQEFLAAFRRGLGPRAAYLEAVTTAAELPRRSELFVVVAPGVAPAGVPAGAVSATAFKDPSDPRWAGDPGLAPFRRVLKDAGSVEGAATAFALVDALRRAGRGLTRASVLAAARRLNEANNPFVVPGIVVKPPIRQVALERWSGGHWNIVSGPLTVSG
jgi:hypothetical protein